jgi:hypothetical protein
MRAEDLEPLRKHMLAVIAASAFELRGAIGKNALDERVMTAMRKVPRHEFVPIELQPYAYDNIPLPIGFAKTISQPFVVALMTDLLDIKADDSVVATVSTPDPVPNDAREALSSIEILDECLVAEICIDRYLWALYQRTPKMDTIKVHERRKVTVKKKGKTVTVTKRFTKLVDNDFTWKDPKAAEKAGMPMMEHGSKLQAEALSYASRGGGGRAVAWHNQRVPR